MPIYEYQCADCGHQLEVMQKISAAPLSECPECGEASLKKLVSAAAFHLKGTGWYATDFKDQPKSSVKSEAKEDKPGDKSKADKKDSVQKSETKPGTTEPRKTTSTTVSE